MEDKDKSSSDKKHNISLRLVLFFLFRCCFAGSPQFSLSTVKQMKVFHSISEMFFTSLTRKTPLRKTFLLECVWSGAQQAATKGGNFGAKLTHLCGFWLDVSFFSHVKKHRSRFWLDVSFFSRVKTIVHFSDWLELICVQHNFLVSISQYVYNKKIYCSFLNGLS